MEQIYTIPVNEAFDLVAKEPQCGCPFCVLYKRLQNDEIDIILGASMMEPDIRIKTNELGFCSSHYEIMLKRKRMLGMGLMMESHLAEVKRLIKPPIQGFGRRQQDSPLKSLECSCYVCSRIDRNLSAMISTAVYLWESEDEFRRKLDKVSCFCLPHYRAMMEYAVGKMSKRNYPAFSKSTYSIMEKYIDGLQSDVSWFCKKFDYRYDAEPWYNSKDSVQRSIKFLSGDTRDEK